jgi:hypothetical protein
MFFGPHRVHSILTYFHISVYSYLFLPGSCYYHHLLAYEFDLLISLVYRLCDAILRI